MQLNTNRSCDVISTDVTNRAYLLYWNEQNAELYLPNTILLTIYLFIGVIGNIAVILVYQFRLNKLKEGRYFIAPLAWIDLTALIVTATLNLTQNTRQIMFPGHGACKIMVYFSYVTTCTSLYLLAAIAIQRYLKICKPFGRQMNLFMKRLAICLCIVISTLVYTPVLVYYGVIEIRSKAFGNITIYQCNKLPGSESQLKKLAIFQGFGFFGTICDVVIITVLYILITTSIVKQYRKMKQVKLKSEDSTTVTSDANGITYAPKILPKIQFVNSDMEKSTDTDSVSQTNIKKRNKSPKNDAKISAFRISFMFMTISIVGFLAYLPSWVLIVMETNNPLFWKQLPISAFHVCLTLRRMYMVNHLVNPFIYGAFDRAFRQEMKKMFCKK